MKKTISLLISLLVIVLLCSFVNVPTVEANSNISVDNYEQNYWAGLSRYGTVFENNYYNKSAGSNSYGTIDLGGLHSWSAWFQSWNQLANTNLYGDCGKVE